MRISGFPWELPGLTLGRLGTTCALLPTFLGGIIATPLHTNWLLGNPRGPKGDFSSISVSLLMISSIFYDRFQEVFLGGSPGGENDPAYGLFAQAIIWGRIINMIE